jgi:hypothetical protein
MRHSVESEETREFLGVSDLRIIHSNVTSKDHPASVLVQEASGLTKIYTTSVMKRILESDENAEEVKGALKRVDGALLTLQVCLFVIHNAF